MPVSGNIQIRPMTSADIDQVLMIEQDSFSHPWRGEHFLNELSSPHSFPAVALLNGHICGYICLMSLFEESQILDIAVVRKQRGKGVATLLLKHAVAVATEHKAEVMLLEVRASNMDAIKLYQRFGFFITGKRANYYENSEDALLMEKLL